MIRQLYGETLKPNRMLRSIVEDNEKEYTYIILGRSGATGKTWIYTGLIKYGFTAFEISENVGNLLDYRDNKNHFIVDDLHKQVIIVLNQEWRI
jgi:hypothetical protein